MALHRHSSLTLQRVGWVPCIKRLYGPNVKVVVEILPLLWARDTLVLHAFAGTSSAFPRPFVSGCRFRGQSHRPKRRCRRWSGRCALWLRRRGSNRSKWRVRVDAGPRDAVRSPRGLAQRHLHVAGCGERDSCWRADDTGTASVDRVDHGDEWRGPEHRCFPRECHDLGAARRHRSATSGHAHGRDLQYPGRFEFVRSPRECPVVARARPRAHAVTD